MTIADQIQAHLVMSLVALVLSSAAGLGLALWVIDHPRRAEWMLGISNLGRTIPSLAVLACAYPIFGAGQATAVVALVALGTPIVAMGSLTALRAVDPDAADAARGLGLDLRSRRTKVELPLALPGIASSIRTTGTQIVAGATLAALIGGGGLGETVMAGLTNLRYDLLVGGALTVAALALITESAFMIAERQLVPAGIRHAAAVHAGRSDTTSRWAAGEALTPRAWLVVGVVACAAIIGTGVVSAASSSMVARLGSAAATGDGSRPLVRMGSKDFTEQLVLAELYSQALEAHGYPVERRTNLGATAVADAALRRGTIDVYPEYTGTALFAVLKRDLPRGSRSVYDEAALGYRDRNLRLLAPTPFSNGNALVVTADTAKRLQLTTISDLAQHSRKLRFGSIPGFDTRPDGLRLLRQEYNLQFGSVRSFENGLKYKALRDGAVDVVYGFETDGQIHRGKLVVLTDDRAIWPPYQAAPVVSEQFLRKAGPDFVPTMDAVSALLSADTMRRLNDEVESQGKSPEAVAQAFLQKHGMLRRGRRPRVVVGSKDFTEQIILGELYAQVLEARGFPVERRLNLGATAVADAALKSGRISLYPEYTGTALTAVLKKRPRAGATQEDVTQTVRDGYRKRGLHVLTPTAFSNGNALAVTRKTAELHKLRTISDLVRVAPQLRFGTIPGFSTRPDGLPLLKDTYGLRFKNVRTFENGLKYKALKDGSIDVVYGFETDGQIHRNKLVVLTDDRAIWPPYQAVPIINSALERASDRDLEDTLRAVSARLTPDAMRSMNDAVEAEGKDPAIVAQRFLRAEGLTH